MRKHIQKPKIRRVGTYVFFLVADCFVLPVSVGLGKHFIKNSDSDPACGLSSKCFGIYL